MAEQTDTNRLIELLVGRQDAQQQQLGLLATTQQQMLEAIQLQQQQITTNSENIIRLSAALEDSVRGQARIAAAFESVSQAQARTNLVLETFGQVQNRLIDQLELIYNELQEFRRQQLDFNRQQLDFNRQQLASNQRQDDFNIIFLEEIRGLKTAAHDVRHDIKSMREEYDERLRRLEDFMNGLRDAA